MTSHKELVLENDACKNGLEAVFMQDDRSVVFTSRSFSDTEHRYAKTEEERENLLSWKITNTYTQSLKTPSKAANRFQNLLLRALQYNYALRYKTGKEIPFVDTLRASTIHPEMEELLDVNNLMMQPIQEHRLAQICYNTVEEATMRAFAEVIARGWLASKKVFPDSLRLFSDCRVVPTVQNGLIL